MVSVKLRSVSPGYPTSKKPAAAAYYLFNLFKRKLFVHRGKHHSVTALDCKVELQATAALHKPKQVVIKRVNTYAVMRGPGDAWKP